PIHLFLFQAGDRIRDFHVTGVQTCALPIYPEAFSTASYSEHITSKGLIIHDKKDNIIPYNDALLIKTKYKNSMLVSTEGYGHSLATEEVSNYIYDFIDN